MATRRQRRVTRARDGEPAGTFSSPACYLHEFEAAATRASARRPARGIAIKRIYDAPESTDGYRVLIDRLWPRGIKKKRAALDAWLMPHALRARTRPRCCARYCGAQRRAPHRAGVRTRSATRGRTLPRTSARSRP